MRLDEPESGDLSNVHVHTALALASYFLGLFRGISSACCSIVVFMKFISVSTTWEKGSPESTSSQCRLSSSFKNLSNGVHWSRLRSTDETLELQLDWSWSSHSINGQRKSGRNWEPKSRSFIKSQIMCCSHVVPASEASGDLLADDHKS